MWDTFVPEGGIKFGDRKFWGLLFLVLGASAVKLNLEADTEADVMAEAYANSQADTSAE